jgi:hypothetical protein
MAAEEPFDAERPPDEGWWTRELHRNEKLMDKFMAALGDSPDWEKLESASVSNVEGIVPEASALSAEGEEDDSDGWSDAGEEKMLAKELEELAEAQREQEDDPDDNPEVNGDYPELARLAREFAIRVFELEDPPENAELLYLSAGKVSANLAGGHGLGYDDEFICGNIVKCRWALSDCEFCREMLEQLHHQTGQEIYGLLAAESCHLAETIRERIGRLRQRVWW